MRKNVLFLVHGVGVHADDWATKTGGPVETLKMAYSGYQTSAGADLDDRMEFVPIRYDDIFDKVLNRWQEMSHGIGVNLPIAQRISELLDESGGNASTAIRYGADVLLYWGLPVVARAVRLRVMVALTGKVSSRDSGTAVPHYGVLGHSLGTTVVHDALHHLATDRWLDDDDEALELVAPSDAERDALVSVADRTGKNPYSPESEFRWRAIYMVANTSRLLHRTRKSPYQSVVRPGESHDFDSICDYFYNIFHRYDPVALLRRFDTPEPWDQSGRGFDIDVDHFHAVDIHALTHYLMHPAVNRNLFFDLVEDFGNKGFREGETKAAAFPPVGGDLEDVAALQARLKALIRDGADDPVAAVKELQDIVKAIKELINGMGG